MAERPDYDALAQDINLEDITSCQGNANILRILRDGDPNWSKELCITNEGGGEETDPDEDFTIREGDDLGWLGYFIGRSEVLEDLCIYYLPEGGDEVNRFFEGMSQNRSLKFLRVSNIIGVYGLSRLGSLFENNHLECFEMDDFMIGHESAQTLALALGRMQHRSLKILSIHDTGISDEGFTEIATALRLQSHLENLSLYNNNIGRSGCMALGNTLSSWPHSNNLETLYLFGNEIDDGGLQALVSGMMNCCSLKQLYLGGNRSITAEGLRSLSPLFQSESHSLEKLHLINTNFRDDAAVALAEGLSGNKSLKQLYFDVDVGITAFGWSAFSRLLCDTSTINSTYLSHHTLTNLGDFDDGSTPEDIRRLLTTNKYQNRQGAAICKILRSHPDLDMEPFFKLKMQCLPAIMSWFDRVEPIEDALITFYVSLIEESERSCQSRKLSALYKFVRAMPDLTTIGYWEGRMIHIEAERLRLADEMRRLTYEKKVTLERLGDQPMDELNRNKRMRLK